MKFLSRRVGLWFILLGLAAAGVVWFGTSVAPWAYSDGVGYLVSARNLVEGPGLGLVKPSGQFEPLITHPPLYPLLLAGGKLIGLDVIHTARLIDVVAFAALVGLCGWLVYRLTGRVRAGLATSLLLLASPPLVLLYLSAMAEPIFLLTGMLALLLLTHGLQSRSRWPLVASAALAGLSALSRYPGAVFVLTGVVMLGLQRGGGGNRLKSASAYAAIGAAPLAVFFALSRFVRTAGAARWLAPLELQPAELVAFLRQLFGVIWTWKPLPTAAVLDSLYHGAAAWSVWINAVLVVGIGASLLAYLWLNRERASAAFTSQRWRHSLPSVCGAFVVLYLGFLLLAFLFSSPTPDVDFRTVLPVLPALLIGGVAWLDSMGQPAGDEERRSRLAYWLLIVAVVAGYLPTTAELLIGHQRTGAGYTARDWQHAEIIVAAQLVEDSRPMVSNLPELFLLHTGRYPYDFTALLRGRIGQCIGAGESSLDLLYRNQGAVLILVSEARTRTSTDPGASRSTPSEPGPCEARILYEGHDGRIMVHPGVVP